MRCTVNDFLLQEGGSTVSTTAHESCSVTQSFFNSVSHVYSIRCTVNYILLQEGGKRCVNKVVMEQKIQYEDSIGRKI